MSETPSAKFRSGFAGLVGRPNVGKSTLLNRLVGEKVAIVSPKPQTTRGRIMGVLHFEGGQIIFVDTPGVHPSSNAFNKQMVRTARRAMEDADLLVCLFEPPLAELGYPRGREGLYLDPENSLFLEHLAKVTKPRFLVVNKVDLLGSKARIGAYRGRDVLKPFVELVQRMATFDEVYFVSAETGEGIEMLLSAVKARLPEGPAYFPEDMFTDLTDRTFAAEVIREKIFLLTEQEIPYACAVTIEGYKDAEDPVRIYATIHVAKDSQKGIVIGRKGQMIRDITKLSKKDLVSTLGRPVMLDIKVEVTKNWDRDERIMERTEYGV